MKKLIFILPILLLTFLFTNHSSAVSGTCSYHGGVNCAAGTDTDGSAVCTDGWRDSSERFADVLYCEAQATCTEQQLRDIHNELGINQNTQTINSLLAQSTEKQRYVDEHYPIDGPVLRGSAREEYFSLLNEISSLLNQAQILSNSNNTLMSQANLLCTAKGVDNYNQQKNESLRLYSGQNSQSQPANETCATIPNAYNDGGICKCKEGHLFYAEYKTCETPEKACLTHYNYSKYENNLCSCIDGYSYVGNNCVKNSTAENNLTENVSTPTNTTYIEKEKSLVKNKSVSLTNKLKGKILLQVESVGEAWYVNPTDSKKYYLQNGAVAYEALKKFGAGISNVDIAKIPIGVEKRFSDIDTDGDGLANQLEEGLKTDPNIADTDGDGVSDGKEVLENNTNPLGTGSLVYSNSLANRFKGRILLQVQSYGEAWYVNPDDGKRYYMKNGEAAYQIMRFLSLGINNDNLRKIGVGDL